MTLLSSLLNKKVVTESGWPLGRLFDVRVRLGARSAKVEGLVVGKQGLRERLTGTTDRQDPRVMPHSTIPWNAAVRLEKDRIVVRDVPEPN
jgi:sporulation protein YlmC with PRC-barrel domain